MSGPYTVTLLQLQPDVAGHASPEAKHELGRMGLDEIVALATRLQQLPPPTESGAAPGIIVRRGEKAWRISAHQGRLRVHHGTSALDDYWTADTAAHLSDLPPFRNAGANTNSASPRDKGGRKGRSATRTFAEVIGLLVVGLVLVYIAAHFGTPRRKLSAPPAGFQIVNNAEERSTIFRRLAGTYAQERKLGTTVVTITPEGQFFYSTLGKDMKPVTPPHKQEQAKAAKRNDAPAIITTSGAITQVDENAVTVGRYRFARMAIN
jgi:hypothetical protein